MILTCPECATGYFVDDARIPPAGRRVRCSSCGHRWLTGPDGPIVEAPAQPGPPAGWPAFRDVGAPDPELPEDDIEVAPPPEAAEPPPHRRAPAGAKRRARAAEARSSALVWAGAAALAAALIAGAIVFREQIVRVWPASSAAYAGLGLAVGGGGLVLEQVRAEPAFLAGRPVLSVTGAIRNVRDEPLNAPPVRLTLLNRAGQPVEAMIARPLDATIPGRARRHFTVTMLDPPATARDLDVRFETAGEAKAPPRSAQAVLTPAPPPLVPAPPLAATAAPAEATPPGAVPAAAAPPPAANLPLKARRGAERG